VSEEHNKVEQTIPPKLTNPLSDVTRKERVYLLGVSAVGITIVFTGLIPTEISTLGITFAQADRKSLLLIFAFVVGYFLIAFVSYALSDFLEWASVSEDRSNVPLPQLADEIFILRIIFDIVIPPMVGLFAIAALVIRAL
jgi:hypothetical protein